MSILQSYINDLTVQNEELVKVTVELEQDANSRVSLLESKLQKTASALKVFTLYFVIDKSCNILTSFILGCNQHCILASRRFFFSAFFCCSLLDLIKSNNFNP